MCMYRVNLDNIMLILSLFIHRHYIDIFKNSLFTTILKDVAVWFRRLTRKLDTVPCEGSNPTMKKISFVILVCSVFLAVGLTAFKLNQA